MIWSKLGLSKKGFTLIELIVFIVVGAIILPASFVAFTAAIKHFSTPDYYVKARFIAEAKMEDITSRVFADLPPDNFAYITNNAMYTNVRDLSGTCIRFCTQDYDNYQWKWTIANYSFGSLDSSVCKTADVSVKMPDGSEFAVSTLVTKRPKS
jgi:prepilin-type N-terminal cleavage/methylation domain-containing protein